MNFEDYYNVLVKLRRELHKIPEIGHNEYKTQEFIIKTLNEFNVENIEKIFGTGVFAIIGDTSKECIAFRCDMDGLNIEEKTSHNFKSENEGQMHGCGHDGHMAILLAFAKLLKDNTEALNYCVKLIFQPAEETDGGALGMIKEGVLENPPVRKVFGFHLWPEIEVGKAQYNEISSFASATRYEISLNGVGGHGAIPIGNKNILYALSYIIEEIKKIDEKYKNSVISVCQVNTSGDYNVFCDKGILKGTIRTLCEDDTKNISNDISNIINKADSIFDCEIKSNIIFEYPCCSNHKEELTALVCSAKKALGDDNVTVGENTFAAEDFGYFTQYTKGAHIKIGTKNKSLKATQFPLHSPYFDMDENALLNGLKILYYTVF